MACYNPCCVYFCAPFLEHLLCCNICQAPAGRPGYEHRHTNIRTHMWHPWLCGVPLTKVRRRGEPLSQEVFELKPDIILAADCVYFEPAFPLLLQTLQVLLALVPTATVFFCFKKRRRADMQFLKSARKTFTVVEIEDEDRPVFSRDGLFLYTFTHKQ